jgi:hypothetical protein
MQPIDFVGFAGDCTISGRMTMFGDRLTDMLNGQERYRLTDVVLESLADGHRVEAGSVSLERADVYAVSGTGPRGADGLRSASEPTRMQLSLGPYLVLGRLHVPPGTDPMTSVLRRSQMVPFTHATIVFTLGGAVVARDLPTLIVNREFVEWITPTDDEAAAFPNVPVVRSPFSLNLAKDFTGSAST